jgi:ATP-dependent DNA helicase RecQ
VLRRLRPPRVVALTATATPAVREQIRAQLGLVRPAVFVRGFDRPNLQLAVTPVRGDRDKLVRCLALFREPHLRGASAIVYAATRKKVEQVALALCDGGIPARAYHGGLDEAERAEVQDLWMAKRIHVVVATNAFGMGVDKRDVRLVVHHDLPGSVEAYYQEVGRAGRDGLPARCVLLFNHADVRLRDYLIQRPSPEGGQKPKAVIEAELGRLRAMTAYAYVQTCRREFLLRHFGDKPCACGPASRACDRCAASGETGPPDEREHRR